MHHHHHFSPGPGSGGLLAHDIIAYVGMGIGILAFVIAAVAAFLVIRRMREMKEMYGILLEHYRAEELARHANRAELDAERRHNKEGNGGSQRN